MGDTPRRRSSQPGSREANYEVLGALTDPFSFVSLVWDRTPSK